MISPSPSPSSDPSWQREQPFTWANLVTAVRTVVGVALFSIAAFERSAAWNFAGLAVYWSLDMLDGFLARRLHQETRLGAQFDILADRLLVAFFYLNYLALHPGRAVVVALFLFEFMVVDHYLSNQFLRWPILSPNYFYKVDRLIWKLNWSLPGKLFNTGLITMLLLLVPPAWPALSACVILIGLKLYCCVRLHGLAQPEVAFIPIR
ncbi:MAG: CDP-alcohol phosphatidyltransferase family protein [Deltaproteobacteria bacterium]|nr:CDP-alcohol phosphatidyltransferase family protein [Deltaproteobacteria bacterium]